MTTRFVRSIFVVLVVAFVALAVAGEQREGARAAGPSPDIVLKGQGMVCDTDPATPVGSMCRVALGKMFTVEGHIKKLAGLIDDDGDTVAGYNGVQIRLLTSAALTLNNRPQTTEMGPFAGRFWPDCEIAAESKGAMDYLIGCGLGIGVFGSTYTGKFVEVDYTCSAIGVETVTAPNGPSPDGHITNENNQAVPDLGPAEALTIDCAFVWDVNGDGWVSIGDVGEVRQRFGQTVPPALPAADIDWDGTVSIGDIGQVVSHFGQQAPP
ncbi:MAG: hypothetical protein WEE64_01230 [Dehalococcoidia bacterium]